MVSKTNDTSSSYSTKSADVVQLADKCIQTGKRVTGSLAIASGCKLVQNPKTYGLLAVAPGFFPFLGDSPSPVLRDEITKIALSFAKEAACTTAGVVLSDHTDERIDAVSRELDWSCSTTEAVKAGVGTGICTLAELAGAVVVGATLPATTTLVATG